MDAESYLMQIQDLTLKIHQRKEQMQELQSSMKSISGIRYDSVKVQTSASSDQIAKKIIRLESLQKKIQEDQTRLQELKDEVITTIHRLTNPIYEQILFLRYVQIPKDGRMMTFWEIADRILYSYVHTRRLHHEALEEVQKMISNDHF